MECDQSKQHSQIRLSHFKYSNFNYSVILITWTAHIISSFGFLLNPLKIIKLYEGRKLVWSDNSVKYIIYKII